MIYGSTSIFDITHAFATCSISPKTAVVHSQKKSKIILRRKEQRHERSSRLKNRFDEIMVHTVQTIITLKVPTHLLDVFSLFIFLYFYLVKSPPWHMNPGMTAYTWKENERIKSNRKNKQNVERDRSVSFSQMCTLKDTHAHIYTEYIIQCTTCSYPDESSTL